MGDLSPRSYLGNTSRTFLSDTLGITAKGQAVSGILRCVTWRALPGPCSATLGISWSRPSMARKEATLISKQYILSSQLFVYDLWYGQNPVAAFRFLRQGSCRLSLGHLEASQSCLRLEAKIGTQPKDCHSFSPTTLGHSVS